MVATRNPESSKWTLDYTTTGSRSWFYLVKEKLIVYPTNSVLHFSCITHHSIYKEFPSSPFLFPRFDGGKFSNLRYQVWYVVGSYSENRTYYSFVSTRSQSRHLSVMVDRRSGSQTPACLHSFIVLYGNLCGFHFLFFMTFLDPTYRFLKSLLFHLLVLE